MFVPRWNGHASSGAQKATFATPTCRDKHVGTIRLSTAYRGESARWLPAVAGRAPMRRFVQQPLPFSTSTRFVNSLVIKFSEYTRLYTRARSVSVKHCANESRLGCIRILIYRGLYLYLNLFREPINRSRIKFYRVENNFIEKNIYIYKQYCVVTQYPVWWMERLRPR